MKKTLQFSALHTLACWILIYFISGIMIAILGSFRSIFLDTSYLFPSYVGATLSAVTIIIAAHASITYLIGEKLSSDSTTLSISLYSAVFFIIINTVLLSVLPGPILLQLGYFFVFYLTTWFIITKKRKTSTSLSSHTVTTTHLQ